MISNEKIFEVTKKLAEKYKLPIASDRIYANEIDNYNYFIVRKGMLRKTSPKHYVRQIEIVYVFEKEQKIDDFEIINTLEEIGISFVREEPDEIQIQKTSEWITMNTYIFEKPEVG